MATGEAWDSESVEAEELDELILDIGRDRGWGWRRNGGRWTGREVLVGAGWSGAWEEDGLLSCWGSRWVDLENVRFNG